MPVEINGLLNHNVSSETHPLPFNQFDRDGIGRMARLHDEWGYDRVLVANASIMPDNFTIAAFIAAQTERVMKNLKAVLEAAGMQATVFAETVPDPTVAVVEKALERRVPPAYAVDSHHWLILHGRYVCQARTPRCWECAVSAYCAFKDKTPAPARPR